MSNTAKAEPKDWTRKALLEALSTDAQEERLARLRRMGVLDENNQLTERATKWGKDYISRTVVEDESPVSE